MSSTVHQAFSHKNFFLTGGTGFMGKVLLYKILKEFPDFGRIYVLTRGKNSRKLKRYLGPQERLKLEVLSSPCFDPLRKALGADGFAALSSRVVAVEGNITDDRLGLSEKDQQAVTNSAHFIVHMAATVNFDERLNVAVETNTLGAMRVLALAKKCKNLEAMVHVSTCYVNYGVQGRVEECLYAPTFEPQGMCKYILALNDAEVDRVSRELLKKHGFPNTYTFTKYMGELLLHSHKGDCPLVIVRPSIVGCSLKEPFPGWVDALTAAGGLILTCGMGLVREVVCRPGAVADIVPVDFVVNVILKALFQTKMHFKGASTGGAGKNQPATTTSVADRGLFNPLAASKQLSGVAKVSLGGVYPTAPSTIQPPRRQQQGSDAKGKSGATASQPNAQQKHQPQRDSVGPTDSITSSEICGTNLPFIYHASTSGSQNIMTWHRFCEASSEYWTSRKPHPRAIGPVGVQLIESRLLYSLKFFFCREVMCHALAFLAELPHPIGSQEKRDGVKKLKRALLRAKDLNRQFCAFTSTEWIFSAPNTLALDEGLDEASRAAFYYDPYMINWWTYCHWYSYGLLKHIVRDTTGFDEPAQPLSGAEVFKRASSL
ncbi:unnamed protein product [Trypanosoma congolense IL3000]|uniref:Fatty acyl-CoA reductase n=1 Tax=Trypanosoma congolense (strain IL3000) TaxID=1068625 RepID=F9WF79_TRYCI|nr:unnamed protein product [Trypanosoma congolense IL3000]